jgi:lysophospholipase L1-like esterase
MTIGDSLTEGAGQKGFQSYRGHLYNILQENGYKIDLVGPRAKLTAVGGDPDHAGYSGFTIGPDDSDVCGGKCGKSNIVAHLDEIMATPADIITVLIGTNDMWPAENRPVKPEDAPEKLKNLVDAIAKQQPEAKIVVCSLLRLPDGGYASKTKEYEAVNAMARQLGARDPNDRIYFADLASVSLSQANGDFADVIHLNARGAQKVAEALAKNLMQVMGQNN